MVRVALRDGGFVVLAQTPSASGEPLTPRDLVIWSPLARDPQRRSTCGDARCSRVGFVQAKIANELPFRIVCRYD